MFEEIYDDVYLVEKYNSNNVSRHYQYPVINGNLLYRQFAYFVIYLTEQINEFSKDYRKMMNTLHLEKKKLIVSVIETY